MRRAIVALVLGLAALGAAPPAPAQVDCILDPTDPACEEPTTTEPPVEEPTTTEPPVETTTATSMPALLEEGPPTMAGAPAPVTTSTTVAAPSDDDDRTGRQVFLVVTALLVLAVVFGLVTYWYWRRTRPAPKLGGAPAGS